MTLTDTDIFKHSFILVGRRAWHIYPEGWTFPLSTELGATFAAAVRNLDGRQLHGDVVTDLTQDPDGFVYWKGLLLLPYKHGAA